jgi:hypothetical protein
MTVGRRLLAVAAAFAALPGCGPDVVGAAATSATAAAAQARQAQEQKARALEQAQAIEKAQQERVDNIDKQTDHAAP